MSESNQNTPSFKPYLLKAPTYKGGKGIDEIEAGTKKIYKLSSNENPIGASPKAVEAIRQSIGELHIYPDRTGLRLQEALETFYEGRLKTDQFVATPSGSESIDLICRAFLNEGDEIIVSNPSFMPYRMFAQWMGAEVVDVPLRDPDYSLDVDGILNAVTEKTKLVFATSPNNPTGTYIPKADLDRLVDGLPGRVILVLDEVYYHFADAPDFITAEHYVAAGKNVIGVNSFSKTYGLAALRLGYCYSSPEIAGYIRQLCKPFLINRVSMNAGIAALSDHTFINETVQLVQRERARLYSVLEELGIHHWKSQGNFVLLRPDLPVAEFASQILKEGIMVRPVDNWGAKGGVRISIGTTEATDALIAALKSIVVGNV